MVDSDTAGGRSQACSAAEFELSTSERVRPGGQRGRRVRESELMFENEMAINRFLVACLQEVAADIPAERVNERAPGNGHPPLWVLGHLAICGELGLRFCGESLEHPRWLRRFGPGSNDEITDPEQYSKAEFLLHIAECYPRLSAAARTVPSDMLAEPHGVDLLANSAISTRGQLISHLLTSHFAFHLAQLSAWRRAAGFAHLF
jgi:hypothetical protein